MEIIQFKSDHEYERALFLYNSKDKSMVDRLLGMD